MVRSQGISPAGFISFGDHHVFKPGELRSQAAKAGADGILTTQKDASRLNNAKFLVSGITIWYLTVKLEFGSDAMKRQLIAKLGFPEDFFQAI
jgi:tetraacyldisaccharide-1-P 4'-kinase